jgi:hypothetical protein
MGAPGTAAGASSSLLFSSRKSQWLRACVVSVCCCNDGELRRGNKSQFSNRQSPIADGHRLSLRRCLEKASEPLQCLSDFSRSGRIPSSIFGLVRYDTMSVAYQLQYPLSSLSPSSTGTTTPSHTVINSAITYLLALVLSPVIMMNTWTKN